MIHVHVGIDRTTVNVYFSNEALYRSWQALIVSSKNVSQHCPDEFLYYLRGC